MLISNNISSVNTFTNSAAAAVIAVNEAFKNKLFPPFSNIR